MVMNFSEAEDVSLYFQHQIIVMSFKTMLQYYQ